MIKLKYVDGFRENCIEGLDIYERDNDESTLKFFQQENGWIFL